MKKTINLSEETIRQIVEQVINEVSTDTAYSAQNKAYERWKDYESQFGPNDARTQRAKDQYINIKNGYEHKRHTDVGTGNGSARRSINREVRNGQIDRGELQYVNGTGWRKNTEDNSDNMYKRNNGGYNESMIRRAIRESIKKILK